MSMLLWYYVILFMACYYVFMLFIHTVHTYLMYIFKSMKKTEKIANRCEFAREIQTPNKLSLACPALGSTSPASFADGHPEKMRTFACEQGFPKPPNAKPSPTQGTGARWSTGGCGGGGFGEVDQFGSQRAKAASSCPNPRAQPPRPTMTGVPKMSKSVARDHPPYVTQNPRSTEKVAPCPFIPFWGWSERLGGAGRVCGVGDGGGYTTRTHHHYGPWVGTGSGVWSWERLV